MLSEVLVLFTGVLLVYYLLIQRKQIFKTKDARRLSIREVLSSRDAPRYELCDNALDVPPAPIYGIYLKLLVHLRFSRIGQWLLVPHLLRKVNNVRKIEGVLLPERATFYPRSPYPPPISQDYSEVNRQVLDNLFKQYMNARGNDASFRLQTVADYRRAYESGQCTPSDVAEAALAAIDLSNSLSQPLRAIIETQQSVVLAMAAASTDRWKNGKTLSLLDGIPVSIKEQFSVEPYACYSGTGLSKVPEIVRELSESPTVQKLKQAGVVIIGVANMQELGAGLLGSNPNSRHLTCRNPYNTGYYCGGSSSGSAASVASGICPVSIGTDGGGSIRIPASLCGVVGFKPTFGLLDTGGVCPTSLTVGVVGSLASCVLDTALMMHVISKETEGKRVISSLKE